MLDFRVLGGLGDLPPPEAATGVPLVVQPDVYGTCPPNYSRVTYTYSNFENNLVTTSACVYQRPATVCPAPPACPTCPTCASCPACPVCPPQQNCPTGYARTSNGTCVKIYPAPTACPTCPQLPAPCASGYARNNAGTCVKIYPAPVACPTCPPGVSCPTCPAPVTCAPPQACPTCPPAPGCPPQGGFPWFLALASGLAIGFAAWGASTLAASK